MAEDSRQINSSTSIIRRNDALKDASVSFNGGRFLTFFLFGFVKGGDVGTLFLGRGSLSFLWFPSSFGAMSLSFTKVSSFFCPRLFALSRDSSMRVVTTSLVTMFCNLSGTVVCWLTLKTFA